MYLANTITPASIHPFPSRTGLPRSTIEGSCTVKVGVETIGCQSVLGAGGARDPDDRRDWRPSTRLGRLSHIDSRDKPSMVAGWADPNAVDLNRAEATCHHLPADDHTGNPVAEASKATGSGTAQLDAQLVGHIVGAPRAGNGRPPVLAFCVPDEAIT